MFKLFFCFSAVALTFSTANANTFSIFSKDGLQATVIVQGSPNDLDASRLFQIMRAPVVEEQGKLTKKASYTGPDGVKAFSIVCAFSKLIPNNGSCIIVMHTATGLIVDSGNHRVDYSLTGGQAMQLTMLFDVSQSNPFFISNDSRLVMRLIEGSDANSAIEILYK